MIAERPNISALIRKVLTRMDSLHSHGIAVSRPPILVPRGASSEIFFEGELFSGIESINRAEACLVPVSTPHVSSTIPVTDYLKVAEEVLGKEALLPSKYGTERFFPPQIILWWRRKDDKTPYDLINLDKLPFQEKKDFYAVISRKSLEAVKLITRLKEPPTIWGTWGYGTVEERVKEGLTRGGPTVGEGHIHFTCFNQNELALAFPELSVKARLNHYAPWNDIILERFWTQLGPYINRVLSSQLADQGVEVSVQRENSFERHQRGNISIRNGFRVDFKKEIPFEHVLLLLTELAGRSDEIYQRIHELFSYYHKTTNNKEKNYSLEKLVDVLLGSGFSRSKAFEFAFLILSMHPTLGQLLSWRDEMTGNQHFSSELNSIEKRIKRYERLQKKFLEKKKVDLGVALVEDLVKMPIDNTITFTWPVHASACYVTRDYELLHNEIYVKSLSLYPEFVTTESAPERELGVVLERPTSGYKV